MVCGCGGLGGDMVYGCGGLGGDMVYGCGCGGGHDKNNDHTWDSWVICCVGVGVEADRMRIMIILGTRG